MQKKNNLSCLIRQIFYLIWVYGVNLQILFFLIFLSED